MTISTSSEDPVFLQQFDKLSAIIANIIAHVIAVVPISLYVMSAPTFMKAYDVGVTDIGKMMSFGMLAASVTGLIVGGNAYRLNLRNLSIIGGLFHIVGYTIALQSETFNGVIVARMISSVGDAFILSSANALLGRSSQNTRYWALSSVITGLSSSVGTFALGYSLDIYGPSVFFIGMIVAGCIAIPFMFLLPTHTLPAEERLPKPGNFFQRLFLTMGSLKGLAIMLSAMLIAISNSAIFSFSAVIGQQANLVTEQIGQVQSMSYIAVTLVNISIVFIATRFGRAKPLLILGAIFATAAIALGNASDYAIYAFGVICLSASYRATTPYLFGVSSRQDKSGGIVASIIVFVGLGFAIGPMLTAFVLDGGDDYTVIGLMSASLFVTAMLVLAYISFGHEKEDKLQNPKWRVCWIRKTWWCS